MNKLIECTYLVLLALIRAYKYAELQLLKLFTPWLQKKGKEMGESVGIVFHCPNDPEWTNEDEKRVLAKCTQYDSLVHIKVKDSSYFPRLCNKCTLASGETFMEGVWDVDDMGTVSEYASRILENDLLDLYWNKWNLFLEWIELCAYNLQTISRAYQVGQQHYDLGNDLYKLMLDRNMQYTCGYWAHADNLDQAQVDKMELIAKKLDLKPGMRVLDIGCGWGYLCKYLAEKYQVECVGVTISEEGVAYGKDLCKGLPVDIRLQDYREVDEKFDRIVSVGMFEHVGFKNYNEYMDVVYRCLKDDGLFLLHTIGRNHLPIRTEPWVHTYIFPNGNLPNVTDIAKCIQKKFVLEDWHCFGPDYAKTLRCWRNNFMARWPTIEHKYGDKFYRMWLFYLGSSVGMFESRKIGLWQCVLSKNGLKNYRAAR